MLKYYSFIVLLIGSVVLTFAQSTSHSGRKKNKKIDGPALKESQPTSLNPYYPTKKYEPPQKKTSGKVTYSAVDEFYERMEAIAKQERKLEKEMEKPENSNPMYFGHKRPPKKRPPGKMKYCKVCGIRH